MSNKVNLATTVTITSTYAGEFSGKYISAALLNSSTIADGGVTVMPNVKYITEHKTIMTRLRAMIDFVNYNNFDLMEKHYNENIDIIEQNYNHVISGDFFHLIMNRIDQYV